MPSRPADVAIGLTGHHNSVSSASGRTDRLLQPRRVWSRDAWAALTCLALALGIVLFALTAQATDMAPVFPGKPAPLPDWIPAPGPNKTSRISFPGAPCSACWGDPITYTTFSTPVTSYAAKRYDGRWITLIIPVQHPRIEEATPDRIRVLVDRLDILYQSYRELLDWEPVKSADPLGKQVFAVLPTEPENFYGLAFAPGDSSEYNNSVLSERGLDDDALSNVWVHELAHNFDAINVWDYGPDPAHDWTTLLQIWFARQQAHMDDENRMTWSGYQESWLAQQWQPYLSNTSLTWQQCAATAPRPAACQSGNAQYLAGSLAVEIGKQATGLQMRNWLRAALAAQNSGLELNGAEARSDYFLNALADATHTNTNCIATHFRWYRGTGLAGAAQYPAVFPGCLDSDGDQINRFSDCDDTRSQVRPGAPEIADGLDNDCNGLVDDLAVNETSFPNADFGDNSGVATPVGPWPLIITGTLADRPAGQAVDVDHIALATPIGGSVIVRLCATGARVYAAGLATNGIGYGPLAAADPGTCYQSILTDLTWRGFWVDRGSSTSVAAGYTLEIGPAAAGWPRPPVVKAVRASDGAIKALLDTSAAALPGGAQGAELRWWQTGAGVVKRGPITDPAALIAPTMTASAFAANGRPVQLRAQLWREDLPLDEPSNPLFLPSLLHVMGVSPNASLSGTWYSPTHDGEGFLVEMLDGGRVLVYWFTYDPKAWRSSIGNAAQQWLLADAQIAGPSIQGHLLRISGGRFGTAMNPSLLVTTDVGDIALAFADDNHGTVHFRVDGRIGEFAIERLTRLKSGPGALGISGSWYQEAYRGQGLIVQETDTSEVIGVMFTFDASGTSAWSILQGGVSATGMVSFSGAPLRTSGGLFGRGFRNSSVVRTLEGSASLSLSCNSGAFGITLPSISPGNQTFALARLTRPMGTQCP